MTNPSRHAELLAQAHHDAEGAYSRSVVASTRLAGEMITRLAAALTTETARHDALRAGVEGLAQVRVEAEVMTASANRLSAAATKLRALLEAGG